jgi:dihydrofolate reductase
VHESRITLIAAFDRTRAIGRAGAMPWHLPDDLKRFKALTLGKPVLMGRKTALAIGRTLPGRPNLVMTRADAAPFAGQVVVHSLDDAVAYVRELERGSLQGVMSEGGLRDAGAQHGERTRQYVSIASTADAQATEHSSFAGLPLMVIGGGEIYALALPRATRMHLTEIETVTPDADTFFPAFDPSQWREVAREHHPVDARHALAFDFVEYARR